MKIYFGFTVAGDRSALETARRLVQLLEGLGHEVLTRHLVNDDAWERDRLISPQDVYRRDMAWLQQCEVLIAEVSGSSFGLGFETGYCSAQPRRRSFCFIVVTLRRRYLSLSPETRTRTARWLLIQMSRTWSHSLPVTSAANQALRNFSRPQIRECPRMLRRRKWSTAAPSDRPPMAQSRITPKCHTRM